MKTEELLATKDPTSAIFALDETCSECGQLHFSKFKHDACTTRELFDVMVGCGDKINVLENALHEAFRKGVEIGRKLAEKI